MIFHFKKGTSSLKFKTKVVGLQHLQERPHSITLTGAELRRLMFTKEYHYHLVNAMKHLEEDAPTSV